MLNQVARPDVKESLVADVDRTVTISIVATATCTSFFLLNQAVRPDVKESLVADVDRTVTISTVATASCTYLVLC